MVRTIRRRAKPERPVERIGHVVRLGGAVQRLRPYGTVRPVVYLAHRADRTRLHPLANLPGPFASVSLIPHLRCLTRPLRRGALERPHLPQRARQRLLAVDVLACLQRRHRDHAVRVIRCGNRDRVDPALALEHLPIILVAFSAWISGKRAIGLLPVYIAQRNEILAAHPVDVVPSHSSHPDTPDVERIAWSAISAP